MTNEYEEVIVRLDKANTIIEEIVRCKDCQYRSNYISVNDDDWYCSKFEGGIGIDPLDYCSYGERKESE